MNRPVTTRKSRCTSFLLNLGLSVCVCVSKWTLCMCYVSLKHVNRDSKVGNFSVLESVCFKSDPNRTDMNEIKLDHVWSKPMSLFLTSPPAPANTIWPISKTSDYLSAVVPLLSKTTRDSNNSVSNGPDACYGMGVCKNCAYTKEVQSTCFWEAVTVTRKKMSLHLNAVPEGKKKNHNILFPQLILLSAEGKTFFVRELISSGVF